MRARTIPLRCVSGTVLTPAMTVVALFAVFSLSGCASVERDADRLFAGGNLAAAARAYQSQIENSETPVWSHSWRTKRRNETALERAYYRLGLIHALPDGPDYRPEKARELLEKIPQPNSDSPGSQYAVQASLILKLQAQTFKLEEIFSRETEKAHLLGQELERLQVEAKRIEGEATDQEARGKRLNAQIARLREEIKQLTTELTAREVELERIKQIDLASPP